MHRCTLLVAALVLLPHLLLAADPQVLDQRLTLQLIAQEPDIVTPIGLTFDHQGRLLVVECNTHFPPQGYQGAPTDRIRIVIDSDGDGDADEWKTFYEGTRATMSLERGADDWLYVATRMEIFRIRDRDGDDVAETRQDLIRLETKGDYPHNGLSGLAFDSDGLLYFGLGENLGERYSVIGRDGRQQRGGGEGGNIYRCNDDGTQLEKLATGFWNPFGICVDPRGRVFAVENDPDASPPCRLLHVVPGGDYGYQFRYGRAGRHPLQAWNGELPGTLPMVAGTGEAPCAVIPYHGQLWVTSWGDYRIERFQLRPRGASYVAQSEVVVQGDENFRPVDFALAPDGSLYFTDWVDKSYEVHGHGRIWRLSWKDSSPADDEWPALSAAEQQAALLRQNAVLKSLDDSDVFRHQAAVWGMLRSGRLRSLKWSQLDSTDKRLGALEAARWQSLQGTAPLLDWIEQALQDADARVRVYALRWVAEANLKQLRPQVEQQLHSRAISPQLFQATLATLEWLDTGKAAPMGENPSYEHYLLAVLRDAQQGNELRALALRLLDPDHAEYTPALFESFLSQGDAQLQRETIRTLVLRRNADKYALLLKIAKDEGVPLELRADAVAGLSDRVDEFRGLFDELSQREDSLAREARQALRTEPLTTGTRPAVDDVDAWAAALASGGNVDAGWRVFFGASGGRCAACHRFEGRGSDVGPDLTLAGQQMPTRRIVDSILNPDREVAPQFVPWNIEAQDGRVLMGLAIGGARAAHQQRYLAADGSVFELNDNEIAVKRAASTSIMPRGIEESLSDDQLRDLLAFLMSGAAE